MSNTLSFSGWMSIPQELSLRLSGQSHRIFRSLEHPPQRIDHISRSQRFHIPGRIRICAFQPPLCVTHLKNNVTHVHPQSSFSNMGPSYLYRSHQSKLPHLPCCLQIIYIHIKSYPHLLVQSSTSSIFIDSRFNKKHHFPWQVHAPPPNSMAIQVWTSSMFLPNMLPMASF